MADERLVTLYEQRLKNTHLPVYVDDEFVLVRRGLPVRSLKEQVMTRNNHDRDQARMWHLWVGEEQVDEEKVVDEIYAANKGPQGFLRLRYGSSGARPQQRVSDRRRVRLTEQESGQSMSVPKYPAVLGRFDNNDVTVDMNQLNHPERNSISRRHAEIKVADDHFTIRNLSQRNLLMVDDQQLEHNRTAQLLPGSTLRLGKVAFTVDIDEI